jgi:hypothetical protein
MKKVSTGGEKGTRNCRDEKLTVGAKLSNRLSWYCMLDK